MASPSGLNPSINDTTSLINPSQSQEKSKEVSWMQHRVRYCFCCDIKKFDAVMIHVILTTFLTTAGMGTFGYLGSCFNLEAKVVVPLVMAVGILGAINCAAGAVYIIKGKCF